MTWLDRELAAGAGVGAPRVGASRFERQLVPGARGSREASRDYGVRRSSRTASSGRAAAFSMNSTSANYRPPIGV